MQHFTEIKSFPLRPEYIDAAAELVINFCKEKKLDSKQTTRIRLSVEESLLLWTEKAAADTKFTIKLGNNISGYVIKVEAEGESIDPYTLKAGDESGGLGNRLLIELGLVPEYAYKENVNELLFKIHRKPLNPVLKIMCVVVSAVLLGTLFNALFSDEFLAMLNDDFLTPVYQAFFRLLGAAAGPMIFLSVAWGIYGIGDAVTLGRIGKKMFALFMCVNAVVAALMLTLYPLLGPSFSENTGTGSGFGAIFSMIMDIIPSNIIEPFYEGNTLQIVFLAIIIGTTLLYLGRRTTSVARAIEQINYVVQYLMKFIAGQVPAVTFLVLFRMVISGTISVIEASWKLVLYDVLAELMILLLLAVWCGFKLKTSPVSLIKKSMPLFLVTATTASSAAGFDTNMQITKDKMGVDPALAAFSVPLGTVICHVGTSVYFPLLCFHFANVYGVEMSWQTLASVVIASVFIGVATPPIPGGGAAAYVALFTQVGIPAEAVAVALALDVIIDFVMTAGCQTPIPMLLAVLAKRSGRLNENMLKK